MKKLREEKVDDWATFIAWAFIAMAISSVLMISGLLVFIGCVIFNIVL